MKLERDIPKPQPSEDVKLPTTVEEYQQERRDAWVKGVRYGLSVASKDNMEDPRATAKRCYPIRRKVQRFLVDADGAEWRCVEHIEGPRLYVALPGSNHSVPATGWTPTPALVKLWSDLLARPYTEVEE